MKRKKTSFQFINIIKKLPILLAVVVVCYTVVLLKTIEFPTLLPVTDIQVKGQLNYLDKKEIRSMVQGAINGGFFTMDLKNVRELLMEKPWVDNVSLRKMWPARLDVIVEEKTPIAYWNGDAYLSEKGNVFKPTSIDNNLNLPGLKGPEGQHDNVWKFMNVLYKETARLNYEVVRLALDERRAWRLTIAEKDNEKNQIDIKLGRYETDKRLQRFVRILPTLITQDGFVENKVRAIDMRYPNGFAVRVFEDELDVKDKTANVTTIETAPLRKSITVNNKTKTKILSRSFLNVFTLNDSAAV